MFPGKSSSESHSHQKLRPEKRKVLIMMRMKPQDHPSQRAEPAESSKYCRSSRYKLGEARRVRVCHFFQENWMNKTCTGSQEVQQFWQTEAIFQHKKSIVRI